MTEAEWLACDDPQELLHEVNWGRKERKLRLFACACSRGIWDLLTDNRSRLAVEVAEQFADGAVTFEQLDDAEQPAVMFVEEVSEGAFRAAEAVAIELDLGDESVHGAWECAMNACSAAQAAASTSSRESKDVIDASRSAILARCHAVSPVMLAEDSKPDLGLRERIEREQGAAHCEFISDIFGNPFRPVAFDPAWRTSTAVAMARGMYESRDFGAMPILADALQDAGCDSGEVLEHCRGPGPHVRGCWVVDLVLGKG
ncbi:Uncharacterized protein OS=Sorangium cellulosum (strain So ce56) GN=sce5710 PE=4 SV=1 [Gemmataceae bacterium]|jgi:hypothetical protein|nr:Uncharacterized protein OS=Sorangium cellulosum (strain So ce56) GN=sce5710 PE=4 SV=1 [Gemmataceae bacterium]VTU01204.1 Uncharacterized protein OS=Sorangium cellulosum (strain So ce56) GN=sce5710 PE=4 SV=1 [Gemmataceae bacterium]